MAGWTKAWQMSELEENTLCIKPQESIKHDKELFQEMFYYQLTL